MGAVEAVVRGLDKRYGEQRFRLDTPKRRGASGPTIWAEIRTARYLNDRHRALQFWRRGMMLGEPGWAVDLAARVQPRMGRAVYREGDNFAGGGVGVVLLFGGCLIFDIGESGKGQPYRQRRPVRVHGTRLPPTNCQM
jgi:hypothetical protein